MSRKDCKINIIFMGIKSGGEHGNGGGFNGIDRSGLGGTLDYRWPRVTIKCSTRSDRSGTIVTRREELAGPIINRSEKGFAKGPIGGAKNGPHYPNDETVFDTVCKQRFLYLNEPTDGGPEPFSYKPRPKNSPSIPGGPRSFLYLNEWAEKSTDVHSGINMEKSI